MGRPSKLTPNVALTLDLLYRRGFTDEEASKVVGVHLRNLRKWREKFGDFASM